MSAVVGLNARHVHNVPLSTLELIAAGTVTAEHITHAQATVEISRRRPACSTPDEPDDCTRCGGTGAVHTSVGIETTTDCSTCEGSGYVCPLDAGVLMFGRDPVSGGSYPTCVECDWTGHP